MARQLEYKSQSKTSKNSYTVIFVCLLFFAGSPTFGAKAPGDIQYSRKGGDPENMVSYPPSIFQHWIHRIRYRCDACHDSLFTMKLGGIAVTHDLMKGGKLCSACHNGEIAFDAGFKNCNRCHVTEKK